MSHRKQLYRTAVHEAGHAVVAHLVGAPVDYVEVDGYNGASVPVHNAEDNAGYKLWDEAKAISRKLVFRDYYGKEDKERFYLRKGYRRVKTYRTRRGFK